MRQSIKVRILRDLFSHSLTFLGLCVLVSVSLTASLTIRFIFIGPVSGSNPDTYWGFVSYSLNAFKNALLPGLIAGILIFTLFRFLTRKIRQKKIPTQALIIGIIGLSAYYFVVFLLGFFLPEGYTFPRVSWILAWIISLQGYLSYSITRQLGQGLQDKIPFSRTGQIFIDFVALTLCLIFSYLIRFDGLPPADYQKQFFIVAGFVIVLFLTVNGIWGIYRFVWRFTSIHEAIALGQSIAISTLILLISRIFCEPYSLLRVPFGILFVMPTLSFIALLGVRALRRIHFRRSLQKSGLTVSPKKVVLVGAGRAGVMLVEELRSRNDFKILGYLDDDRQKRKRIIAGYQVLGTTDEIEAISKKNNVDEFILAMPTAPKKTIRKVLSVCNNLGIGVSSVPSLSEILLGKVTVGRLRPVQMKDLLGRDSIEFPASDRDLQKTYYNRRILVTGAAGSIGSELIRQLVNFEPTEMFLLDKDENGLYETALEFQEIFSGNVEQIVADIRNRSRMLQVFTQTQPEVIFHAAAYKHVPMMEINPVEAITSNILGTRNLAEAAVETDAKMFLLISTDKAVNPTSIMGASKRVAEMIVRDLAIQSKNTRFCCVRFGNVLGSRASVIPLFQKRIAQGKNIKVTHPEIKRYFMTIPEASQLVIQAGSLARAGETFVLDMGDPVKIVDLARDLIEHSGLVVGEDIEIEYTGLRPGEKLFEELLIDPEEGYRSTKYSKIFVEQPLTYESKRLSKVVDQLQNAAENGDIQSIYRLFQAMDIGYHRTLVPIESKQEQTKSV